MNVISVQLGVLNANCYIISSDSGHAAAVDVGGNPQNVLEILAKNNLLLKKIILTHGHYDHIGGTAQLAELTNAEVLIHSQDANMLTNPKTNLAYFAGVFDFKPIIKHTPVEEDDAIILDELTLNVMHTPGHTNGSVCFISENIIFSGDTLFKESIGRTDLPGGDFAKMKSSLKKIAALNQDFIIYPGHGDSSSLNHEKNYNPYLKDIL